MNRFMVAVTKIVGFLVSAALFVMFGVFTFTISAWFIIPAVMVGLFAGLIVRRSKNPVSRFK